MAALVTMGHVKDHLRITTDQEDLDLELKITQASAIVLGYIDRPDVDWRATIDGWTYATVPAAVQAAVLLQVGDLYQFRGDETDKRDRDDLAPGVARLLQRYRDPVLA